MEDVANIAKVVKNGINLPISVDVFKIVAISDVVAEENTYYIYFDNAVWSVKSDSYEEVLSKWIKFKKRLKL